MNASYADLVDPLSGEPLGLYSSYLFGLSGQYPIVGGIPRFVQGSNYADDFGKQWNLFRATQLDSFTGIPTSYQRLSRCMNGHLDLVANKKVLEAGSGAGRFTEILLEKDAILHSFDFSNAVEANRDNNGSSANLLLVQADIRQMPFKKAYYDYVICLGVIQHTPSPEESISCLYQMVKPGGYLVIDHYIFRLKNLLPPPIGYPQDLFRQIILRVPRQLRYRVVQRIVDIFFPLHWQFRNTNIRRKLVAKISPVCFYYDQFGLYDKDLLYQWALLDTHDGTTDVYRHLRSSARIKQYLSELGADEISVREAGNGLEAFCRKPD